MNKGKRLSLYMNKGKRLSLLYIISFYLFYYKLYLYVMIHVTVTSVLQKWPS